MHDTVCVFVCVCFACYMGLCFVLRCLLDLFIVYFYKWFVFILFFFSVYDIMVYHVDTHQQFNVATLLQVVKEVCSSSGMRSKKVILY